MCALSVRGTDTVTVTVPVTVTGVLPNAAVPGNRCGYAMSLVLYDCNRSCHCNRSEGPLISLLCPCSGTHRHGLVPSLEGVGFAQASPPCRARAFRRLSKRV